MASVSSTTVPPARTSPGGSMPSGGGGRSMWRSQTRRDQLLAFLLGVGLLSCSIVANYSTNRMRPQLVREDPESERTLRSLAVTFPRLTLGGMRGIVSTYLWIKAEDDKNNRKWLDLETKYDAIGALQPYFSSVYIYHAWNQAYNMSAQWQEQDIKYKWVLDGLAYLYKGEEYNPGNPDIFVEEGHLYFLKLGGASERIFYRQHWRNDLARLHELNNAPDVRDDATVSLRHVREIVNRRDSGDKSNYFHIEELHNPNEATGAETGWGIRITDPTEAVKSVNNPMGFNLFSGRQDGKKATEPVEFRYGVSPYYFAYIEYRRCQALRRSPTYTGMQIVDSWPAMSLRLWCRDDLYYTGQIMDALFGSQPNEAVLSDRTQLAAAVAEAQDCYRNVQMIAPRAIDLFTEYLNKYPLNITIHKKHMLETQAYMDIVKAEMKLFGTLVQWNAAGRKTDPVMVKNFQDADDLYKAAYKTTLAWVDNMFPVVQGRPADPDRDEWEAYANHLMDRSRGIEALLTLPPDQKPNMSFLNYEHENLVER